MGIETGRLSHEPTRAGAILQLLGEDGDLRFFAGPSTDDHGSITLDLFREGVFVGKLFATPNSPLGRIVLAGTRAGLDEPVDLLVGGGSLRGSLLEGFLELSADHPARGTFPTVRLGSSSGTENGLHRGDVRVFEEGRLRVKLSAGVDPGVHVYDGHGTPRAGVTDRQVYLAGSSRPVVLDQDRLRIGPTRLPLSSDPGLRLAIVGLPFAEIGVERGPNGLGGYLKLGCERNPTLVKISGAGIEVTPDKAESQWDPPGFLSTHPDDPGKQIRYCVVEAPEVGLYVRGTARLRRGRARVALPDHFAHVTSGRGLTVHLTPRSARSRGVAAVSLTRRTLVVRELGGGRGNYSVDYVVHGVRRGREGYQVVRNTPGGPSSK